MKRYEITLDSEKVTIHREIEEHLTAEQKYNLLMASIVCMTACVIAITFLSLFWR